MTETGEGRPGSTLDEFLAEEGFLEEATDRAIKGVLAWQIGQAMEAQKLTKAAMARRMETSRAQLDRLLDPARRNNYFNCLSTTVRLAS